MGEPTFDQETLEQSLADIEAGMVRYLQWTSVDKWSAAWDLIHHAWMQGAFNESKFCNPLSANPYFQRDYRMAWFAGFDIATRIRTLGESADADLAALRAENQRLRGLCQDALKAADVCIGSWLYDGQPEGNASNALDKVREARAALAENQIAHEQGDK